jgi:Fic family protein
MYLIHFQFESIHPYYDGNGRTGKTIIFLEKLPPSSKKGHK